MGLFDWSQTPDDNATADEDIPVADGSPARDYYPTVRSIMAALRRYGDDVGGALTTGGVDNAFTVTTASGIDELRDGLCLLVRFNRPVTGGAHLVVDNLPSRPIADNGGGYIEGGRIVTGQAHLLIYEDAGARWRIVTLRSASEEASVPTTDAVTEGVTNLYYTDARARSAISVTGSLGYNSTTGVISYSAPVLAPIATSGSASDLSAGTVPAARQPALTGDVTTTVGTVATTIANNAVTLGKMATVATARFLGRVTASTGNVEALTGTQATSLLDQMVGATGGANGTKGLVPQPLIADLAKVLKGDGTWLTLATVATSGSAANLTGTLAAAQLPAMTGGDVTSSAGSANLTIGNNTVTLAKMATVATARFLGRTTASTGNVEALTGTQATAMLDGMIGATGGANGTKGLVPQPLIGGLAKVLKGDGTWMSLATVATSGSASDLGAGTLPAARYAAFTGDVTTVAGNVATTIAADAVTNTKLANMATATIKGRTTAGTGDPEDLTPTQATALLDVMVGAGGSNGTKGLVPQPLIADAGKFLNGAGAWATPAGSGDVVGPASSTNNNFALFNGTTGKLIKDGGTPAAIATSGSAADLSAGTIPAGRMPALTGDVTTSAGAVATTIANNAVTLAKMATVATARFLGRTTAATGNVEALTGAQATALLDAVAGDIGSGGTKGLVPAPAAGDADANKFLKASGAWTDMTSPVAFRVYRSADQGSFVPGVDTKCTFQTEVFDVGPCWASSTFTAPIAGKYYFYFTLYVEDNITDGISCTLSIYKNGAVNASKIYRFNGTASRSADCSALISLAASDTVEFYMTAGGSGNKSYRADAYLSYAMGFRI